MAEHEQTGTKSDEQSKINSGFALQGHRPASGRSTYRDWKESMNGQSGTRLQRDSGCGPVDVSPSASVRPPAVLQELVQLFHVCWVILPEIMPVGRDQHRAGFLLELQTTHEHREKDFAKDCAHCQRARGVLRVVADWIVRHAKKPCTCSVDVQAPFVRVATPRGNREFLKLTLRVVHHQDCEQYANDCETCWLNQMRDRLGELGATEEDGNAGRH